VNAQPESRELLALCLKKLRGLNKVRLIDAGFIWTEPHSRRIKVKLTVQKEAFTSTILQQTFECEFVVAYQQCSDCAKTYTKNTWRAMVQVRQKVPHKRTFLYLEQLILKHHAHKDASNIREAKDGLDFFYQSRSAAVKMVEFLGGVVPTRSKKSEELISMDVKNNTQSYKFTYSVEIVPICKDDLICLPPKTAKSLSNIGQLVLCHKIAGNTVHLLDPRTLQTTDLPSTTYWRQPFDALAAIPELVEFVILDVEIDGRTKGKMALADIEVARDSDMGSNDDTYWVISHLGGILHPGDTAMGYFLSNSNLNNPEYDNLLKSIDNLPDVVLVKKVYPERRKRKPGKIRGLDKETSEMTPRKQDVEKLERDYEMFLEALDEDEDMKQLLEGVEGLELAEQDQDQEMVQA
jgi:nonsense-mediated mRNA decay protein 3